MVILERSFILVSISSKEATNISVADFIISLNRRNSIGFKTEIENVIYNELININ